MTSWDVAYFLAGFLLLVGGAEIFLRGATRLAKMLGISPLVIGLTVVALGTTAPEIAVSVTSSLQGKADLALGNVVGSNILNVLLILGVSAVIVPLTVSRQLIRLDVPIMIAASVLAIILSLDGGLGHVDGAVLILLAIAYTAFQVFLGRREVVPKEDEFAQKFTFSGVGNAWTYLSCAGLIVAGAAALVQGSNWLVAGAVAVAQALGVSEMITGLTVIAVGTSLPEAATSVMASIKGQRDIAVGNVIGSNIYNILAVLGAGAVVGSEGIPVSPAALHFDLPVLVGVAVACLPIFFSGHRISRPEGLLFLFYYVVYTVYLIMASSHHDSLPAFSILMLAFVLPVTIFGIGVSVYRTIKAKAE